MASEFNMTSEVATSATNLKDSLVARGKGLIGAGNSEWKYGKYPVQLLGDQYSPLNSVDLSGNDVALFSDNFGIAVEYVRFVLKADVVALDSAMFLLDPAAFAKQLSSTKKNFVIFCQPVNDRLQLFEQIVNNKNISKQKQIAVFRFKTKILRAVFAVLICNLARFKTKLAFVAQTTNYFFFCTN